MKIDDRLLAVDAHGTLAITSEIWLATIFSCRYFLLGLMALVSVLIGQGQQVILILGHLNYLYFLVEIPALIFFWSCLMRKPKASNFMVRIWSLGRYLIPLSASLHAAIGIYYFTTTSFYLDKTNGVLLCFLALDVIIAYYFIANHYIHLVLAEHPATQVMEK
jgi:hypothetical protein